MNAVSPGSPAPGRYTGSSPRAACTRSRTAAARNLDDVDGGVASVEARPSVKALGDPVAEPWQSWVRAGAPWPTLGDETGTDDDADSQQSRPS